jgi:trk system potassium uptake protein TrkA
VFVVIVGAGKVGLNVARSLTALGHEVALVESRRSRHVLLARALGERLLYGDGTEMDTLERAGIARADLVVAVTGDDEDNVVIALVARLEYGVAKVVARVNDPRNQKTFDLLGIDATVCATTLLMSLIQHELPGHHYVPLLQLRREGIDLVEIEVSHESPGAHLPIGEIRLPKGVLLAAVLRGGRALLARPQEVLLPGDQALFVLEPGTHKGLIAAFMPSRRPEDVEKESSLDWGPG